MVRLRAPARLPDSGRPEPPHPGGPFHKFPQGPGNPAGEAGIQAESFHPDTIIIDMAMGRSDAVQIASNLRKKPDYETTLIIALASEDEAAPETLANFGFNEAFKKPFDVALLGERIRTLVEEKRANM